MTDRRHFLIAAVGGMLFPRLALPQASTITKLTETLSLVHAGTNVLAFSASDGIILVDSGAPQSGTALKGAVASPVRTVFNTHYHLENTGSNELFSTAGAKIIAHERTRQWMSTDYWVPVEDRFEKARPKAARPTEVFQTIGSMQT